MLSYLDWYKIKKFWQKYNVYVCIVLLGYSAYKTFVPSKKIIEKTVTKTIVDTESLQRVKSDVAKLYQLNQSLARQLSEVKNIANNIKVDEVIKEIQRVDGTVERTIERKMTDLSTTVIKTSETVTEGRTTVESSTSTYTAETSTKTHTSTTTESTKITITKPIPFWASMLSYQFVDQQVTVGQGINLGQTFTIMGQASYSFGMNINNRFDYGLGVILRY